MTFVQEKFGRLDGLVNNAGIAPIAHIEDRIMATGFGYSGWHFVGRKEP